MTGTRRFAWDGLAVDVPASWEPARLGLGYVLLEDSSGPRLSLRWQRLKKGLGPEKVLKRLARRTFLQPDGKPRGAVAAMLSALPGGHGALPCADASGRGADAVLFTLPDAGLAVLAAPHARPDEKAAPWAEAAASVAAAHPGAFSLYDVAGEAPDGFALAAFKVQLGHYHFHYRSRRGALDYYRFAPSEVILRGKSLEGWAGEVFVQTLGQGRVFRPGYLDSFPCASWASAPGGDAGQALRTLAARVFARARFARGMAWKPDASRILAVVARHGGDLSPLQFEEVCRRYVVQAT